MIKSIFSHQVHVEKYSKFGFRFLWIETKDIGFAKRWIFNKEV
jgi:hypothetical protein